MLPVFLIELSREDECVRLAWMEIGERRRYGVFKMKFRVKFGMLVRMALRVSISQRRVGI